MSQNQFESTKLQTESNFRPKNLIKKLTTSTNQVDYSHSIKGFPSSLFRLFSLFIYIKPVYFIQYAHQADEWLKDLKTGSDSDMI